MTNNLRNQTYLLIVFAGLFGLICIVVIAICSRFHLKRRKHGNHYTSLPTLHSESLKFTYETNIETQTAKQAGSLASNGFSDLDTEEEDHLRGNNIDLVQPLSSPSLTSSSLTSASLTSSSGESSDCINAVPTTSCETLERFASLPSSELGRISYALFYNEKLETLRVNVIQWYNSGSHNIKSTLSPYVKVRLLPPPSSTGQYLTKTKRADSPVFDEEFSFTVQQSQLDKISIEFSVCDFDKFSRQNILGRAVVQVEEVLQTLTLSDGTGELWMELTESNELSNNNNGDVLISLSYFPTANRVTLTLVKAKNLNVGESDTGVSIKASMLISGKITKTRKTSVRDATDKSELSDLVCDKTWAFLVPCDVINDACIVVNAHAYSHNTKRIIGKTSAGLNDVTTAGFKQWKEMLSQPGSTISYWHKLK